MALVLVVLLSACRQEVPAAETVRLERLPSPVSLTVELTSPDQVVFRVRAGGAAPTLSWQSDVRPTVVTTQLRRDGDGWVGELSALSTSERGLLIIEGQATAIYEWSFEGTAEAVSSEVHSFDGELSLLLPDGLPAEARVSMLKSPMAGLLAGPFTLSSLGGVVEARGVFSPGSLADGASAATAATLKVVRLVDGGWEDVPSTVHRALGRVAFRAALPGTYALAGEVLP